MCFLAWEKGCLDKANVFLDHSPQFLFLKALLRVISLAHILAELSSTFTHACTHRQHTYTQSTVFDKQIFSSVCFLYTAMYQGVLSMSAALFLAICSVVLLHLCGYNTFIWTKRVHSLSAFMLIAVQGPFSCTH